MIKITHEPKRRPTYDPYEECCAGSHEGEKVTLVCGGDIIIEVQEMDSGIGPSYNLSINGNKIGSVFIDDEGEFTLGRDRGTIPIPLFSWVKE